MRNKTPPRVGLSKGENNGYGNYGNYVYSGNYNGGTFGNENTNRSSIARETNVQGGVSCTRRKKKSFSNNSLSGASSELGTFNEKKQMLKKMIKDSFTESNTPGYYAGRINGKYNDYRMGDTKNFTKKSTIESVHQKTQKVQDENLLDSFPNFSGCAQMKRYQVMSVLGMGSFATAYLALDKVTNVEVAIKCYYSIRKSYLDDAIRNEGDILSVLDHPNIVKLHKMVFYEDKSCLVLELCPQKSLLDYIRLQSGKRYFCVTKN